MNKLNIPKEEDKVNRHMILMRGISGSGKTTKAISLANDLSPGKYAILSTDDRVTTPDFKYLWDPSTLALSHTLNQKMCETAAKKGLNLIIIDNTNLTDWERQPYLDIAKKYNYSTEIVDSEAPWAKDPKECFQRNHHCVPKEVIEKQYEKLENDKPA